MNHIRRTALMLSLCVFGGIWSTAQEAPAQEAAGSGQADTPTKIVQSAQETFPAQSDNESKKEETKKAKRGSLVIAPFPISNPAIGSGLVLAVGYIFPFSKNDKVSPPSVIGVAGLYTNNETRGLAVVGQFYLKQNTYKLTTGYARGNVNYDLYGSRAFEGLKLPLQQTGQLFRVEVLRRVGWKFFLGPQFSTGSSTITLRPSSGDTPPPPPDLGLHTTLTAVGATLTRDTSLNRFYPTNGTFFNFSSDFFSQTLGSKYSFQKYVMTFSKYWSLTENQVVAYNGYFCGTGGQPPFYGNCIYGTSNQLRGYVAGKYFNRYMVTTQVEYRLALPWRLGVVAFGGLGEAIPGDDQLLFRSNNFLPSGGGGLRFQLSKQYHVNLRADIAGGKDGHTFSLGLGEAF
jgi:outer membrane protein assembly factor BamA